MTSTVIPEHIRFCISSNILRFMDVAYIRNDINLKYGGARGEQSTLLGDHVNSDHYSQHDRGVACACEFCRRSRRKLARMSAMIHRRTCESGDRHCDPTPEQDQDNIFERNRHNSDPPTNDVNTTASENGSQDSYCTSDSSGSFSVSSDDTNNSSEATDLVVQFQYQVQTALSETVTDLQSNSSALLAIEKAISDILVASFFEECRNTTTASELRLVTTIWSGFRRKRRDLIRIRRNQDSTVGSGEVDLLTGVAATPSDRLLPGRAAGTLSENYFEPHLGCLFHFLYGG
jgi:hypothetical protein